MPVTEGKAPFRDCETWYRVTGQPNSALTPLPAIFPCRTPDCLS